MDPILNRDTLKEILIEGRGTLIRENTIPDALKTMQIPIDPDLRKFSKVQD